MNETTTEFERIAVVIERAGTGIKQNDRPLHDWLAQVLQVLISRLGLAEMEAAEACKTSGLYREDSNRDTEAKRNAEGHADRAEARAELLAAQLKDEQRDRQQMRLIIAGLESRSAILTGLCVRMKAAIAIDEESHSRTE